MSNEAIADKLDTTVPTVRLCLDKFNASGVQCALEDVAGRGRRAEIFDDSKAWVVNIACQKPTAFGLSAELWYPTSLTKYVNSVAEKDSHADMIVQILKELYGKKGVPTEAIMKITGSVANGSQKLDIIGRKESGWECGF